MNRSVLKRNCSHGCHTKHHTDKRIIEHLGVPAQHKQHGGTREATAWSRPVTVVTMPPRNERTHPTCEASSSHCLKVLLHCGNVRGCHVPHFVILQPELVLGETQFYHSIWIHHKRGLMLDIKLLFTKKNYSLKLNNWRRWAMAKEVSRILRVTDKMVRNPLYQLFHSNKYIIDDGLQLINFMNLCIHQSRKSSKEGPLVLEQEWGRSQAVISLD